MGHMKVEKVVDGSWVHPMEFGVEDGHQHVDDDSDLECDMVDVKLNIPSLQTNNSQTNVPTSKNGTGLASQIEQLHSRIDQFENKVSLDISQLSNLINEMSTRYSKLIALVRSVCPPLLPNA